MLIQRHLFNQHKCDPHAFVVLSQTLVGLLALVFAFIHGFHFPDFSGLWLAALGSVSFHSLGYIAHAKALQTMEASVFSMFYATQAIWIMLLGVVLFREHPSALQFAGVVCIFVGIAFLTLRTGSLQLNSGTLLGLLTGLLFGIAVTCWVYVGKRADIESWAALGFLGVAGMAFLIRPHSIAHARSFFVWSIAVRMLVVSGLMSAGGVALLLAYAAGDVSAVSPLRQMSIVVTVLLAMLFLPQERTYIWHKFAAMALCFLGALLVV